MPSSLETRPDATPHDSARSLFFSSLSSAIDAPWALRRSAKSIRQSVLAFQINSASSVPRRRRESGRETLEAWVFAVQLVWDYEPVSPFGRRPRRACFRPFRPISSASSSVTSRTMVPLEASLNLIVTVAPLPSATSSPDRSETMIVLDGARRLWRLELRLNDLGRETLEAIRDEYYRDAAEDSLDDMFPERPSGPRTRTASRITTAMRSRRVWARVSTSG